MSILSRLGDILGALKEPNGETVAGIVNGAREKLESIKSQTFDGTETLAGIANSARNGINDIRDNKLSPLGPIKTAVETAQGYLLTIRDTLLALPTAIGEAVKNAFIAGITEAVSNMANQFFDGLKTFMEGMFTKGPAPPQMTPVDPGDAMAQIATAIHDAEKKLNEQSLLISSGTVEVDVYVGSGATAGAHARIVFNIAPKQ